MAGVIRVLLVDDHPIVLDGFASALAADPDIEVAGKARSVAEARAILRETRIDVALVDLRLPDGSGFDILADASPASTMPAFLIVSTFQTAQYVDAAVRLGASGFLLKTAPTEEILAAIRRIAAGGTAFSAAQLHGVRQAPWDPLTEREAAIVRGVMGGRSNDELSAETGVSKKTVEAYLTRLFERHRVTSRVELAVKASEEGWLDLPRPTGRRRTG